MTPTAWPLVGRADELAQALDSLASGRGAVLSGVAGVGKSRLAAEVLTRAAAAGWATVSLAAGPETAAAPFSPFAPLLPGDDGDDPVARFLRATRNLTSLGERVVVAVDDAHLLDEVSVAFVRHLLTATSVRLLLTIRSGTEVPSTLVMLWQAGMLRRLEVLALARDETERLVAEALPGPVHPDALAWVWQTTSGNPLFVHELVLDACERGALAAPEGRWQLDVSVRGAGSRLQEVVAARVGSLSPAERVAVELVAVGEPLGLGLLETLAGAEVVASLDERGLLATRTDRRRTAVRLAHPLHGEVVRATMTVPAGRARRRQLVDATEAAGAHRGNDAVRLAVWRCEIGDVADWPALLAAAEQLAWAGDRSLVSALNGADEPGDVTAHGHLEQAALLARGALDGGRSMAAAALLARLLTLLGRDAEAAAVHDEAVGLAATEDDALALVRMRAVDVFFVRGDAETAQALLRDFAEHATDPNLGLAASASLALVTALNGAPAEALLLARRVLDDDGGEHGDRLLGMAAAAVSLGEAGKVTEALVLVDAAFEALLSDDRHDLVVSLSLVRGLLLASAGRMPEAEELVRSCYAVAARTGDGGTMGVFAALAAHLALERGHATRAVTLATEAADRLADVDPYGLRRIALALRMHASALAGQPDDARAVRVVLDSSLPSPSQDSQERRARAWLEVAEGRTSIAAGRLQAAAETQAATGHVLREAAALHDLVRLAHAPVAVERLEALAAQSDTEVVDVMAAQARASADGDADALVAVAGRWSALAFDLFAAETHAAAAVLFDAARRRVEAASARTSSRNAVARCGTVATPALCGTGVGALTRREHEIAGLAARGLADRQIAAELVVSVRTVQTHLYNAYAKLGVDGRTGLAAALPVDVGDSSRFPLEVQ